MIDGLVGLHIGCGGISDRSVDGRHWIDGLRRKGIGFIDGSPSLSRRISDAQSRSGTSQIDRRRPHRGSRYADDLRDARKMRRLPIMGEVPTPPSHSSRKDRRTSHANHRRTAGWWCFGGIVNFSGSDEGQTLYLILREHRITPQEWREMDPRDCAFLANGFVNMKTREADHAKREQMRRRMR